MALATLCYMGIRPQFSAHVCCGQMAGWIKIPLGAEVGLGPGDIVLDGDPAPSNKGHSTPHFSTHVDCGQTAGWIKMPLGTEVDLSTGHIVLDGDPALIPSSRKGHKSPFSLYGPYLLWLNGRPSELLLSTC